MGVGVEGIDEGFEAGEKSVFPFESKDEGGGPGGFRGAQEIGAVEKNGGLESRVKWGGDFRL